MAGRYNAAAAEAIYVADLERAMNEIDAYGQSEKALESPLRTSARMWQAAGEVVNQVIASFPAVNNELLALWTSPADSSLYRQAGEASVNSLSNASAAISGSSNAGGPGQNGGSIPARLSGLADMVVSVAASTGATKQWLDQAIKVFRASLMPRGIGKGQSAPLTAEDIQAKEIEFVNNHRGPVLQAAALLQSLAGSYESNGPAIVAAAQSLQWVGPGAGNRISGSRDGGPGGPGGTPNGGDMGPAGGPEAGTDQAGPEGGAGDAGGAPPGGETAPPGGETAPQGGPGLAGVPPTLPATAPPSVSTMPPNIPPSPPAGVPPLGTLPVGGLPVGGTTNPSKGGGRFGGGGGIGGGKADFPRTGTTAQNLPTVGQQQIPRAGEQLTQSQPLSGGRPSATTTGGTGLAGNTSAGTGAGGVPPMMPPGGAGAAGAGGNRAGKPGSGAIRPVGRKRERKQDETPGVPVGLRGKAGRDLPGAFPAVAAGTRRRHERDEADTLQLLDEDLWKVEETEVVAAPAQRRRLAN